MAHHKPADQVYADNTAGCLLFLIVLLAGWLGSGMNRPKPLPPAPDLTLDGVLQSGSWWQSPAPEHASEMASTVGSRR